MKRYVDIANDRTCGLKWKLKWNHSSKLLWQYGLVRACITALQWGFRDTCRSKQNSFIFEVWISGHQKVITYSHYQTDIQNTSFCMQAIPSHRYSSHVFDHTVWLCMQVKTVPIWHTNQTNAFPNEVFLLIYRGGWYQLGTCKNPFSRLCRLEHHPLPDICEQD